MADKVINKKATLLDNSVFAGLLDRQLVSLLNELPDPDVILRKAGVDQDVYNEILADSHVMGEVRSLWAGLVEYKFKLVAGDDSSQAQNALELCESIFANRPHPAMTWRDLIWSIGKANLHGRRAHNIQWEESENKFVVPAIISDIHTRSYGFNYDGELLIYTQSNPSGEIAEQTHWIATRHMPDAQNPYGVAILSSCFWPWMFKNGGFRFFVKLCEKFGVPWPVGKYPVGATEDDVNALVERLQAMVEDAVAAIPEGVELDLLEMKSTGEVPQERLIKLCDAQMSKALTSQTLATEINGQGSRAAAETHLKRSDKNAKADRVPVKDFFDELFAKITYYNFGPNVAPPKFTWDDKKERNQSDVNWFKGAAGLVPIKKDDVYKGLELSEPGDDDDVLYLGSNNTAEDDEKTEFARFAKANEWLPEDQAISDIIDQIKGAIDEGETLEDALDNIVNLMPELDQTALEGIVRNELELDFAKGMNDA